MSNKLESNQQNDATVLLTGTHVEQLTQALRGVNTVIVRLEGAVRDLIKSNRELKQEFHKLKATPKRAKKHQDD